MKILNDRFKSLVTIVVVTVRNALDEIISHHKKVTFWWLLAFLVFIKLYLIRYQDIAAIYNGHDDVWFLMKAKELYWNITSYNSMSFIKEPLYPIFVAFTKWLGVNLRLMTEVSYLCSGVTYAYLLFNRTRALGLSIISACTIFFFPFSFTVFQRATSDALYVSLILFMYSMSMFLLSFRKCRPLVVLIIGIFAGLISITRPEQPYILLCVLGVYSLAAYIHFTNRNSWKIILAEALLIFLPILIITNGIKTINYAKYGIWCISEQTEPAYQKALSSLVSIRPDEAHEYAFVQMRTLKKLAGYSPSIAKIYPKLKGNIGKIWASYAVDEYRPPKGEIGVGHFPWALRMAAESIGMYKSPQTAIAFYKNLSDEIDDAVKTGHFETKWAIPTLGQNFKLISNRFWNSLLEVSSHSLIHKITNIPDDAEGNTLKLFNWMAMRKIYSVQSIHKDIMQNKSVGWIFLHKKNNNLINIISSNGYSSINSRPDVAKHFNVTNDQNANYGFTLHFKTFNEPINGYLRFQFEDGDFVEIPIKKLNTLETEQFYSVNSSRGVKASLALDTSNAFSYYAKSIMEASTPIELIITRYFPWFILVGWLFLAWHLLCKLELKSINLLLLSLGGFVFALFPVLRILLFAMIDSSAFPGTEPRYLFPGAITAYLLPYTLLGILYGHKNDQSLR